MAEVSTPVFVPEMKAYRIATRQARTVVRLRDGEPLVIGGLIRREEVEQHPELRIVASSDEAGVYAVSTENGRQIFITGHSEYDPLTLEREYKRDVQAGKPIAVPKNYYPNDDPSQPPIVSWRAHANLIYSNWLNYFVYQTTPYDLDSIG